MDYRASFKKILADKMGTDPSLNTSEPSLHTTDFMHMAYLLGQVPTLSLSVKKSPYPAHKPARKPHVFSELQQKSFEFLRNHIHTLSEGFTRSELRRAFRTTALKLHPDHGGCGADYVCLRQHYQNLLSILD